MGFLLLLNITGSSGYNNLFWEFESEGFWFHLHPPLGDFCWFDDRRGATVFTPSI